MAYTENEIYYPYDYDASADVPEDMKTMAESIDEVIGEIKGTQTTQNTRLSALETGQTSQSTSIQSLQSENTRLKKNQIYGTATGTEVEITDSAEMEASIGVSGASEQETRSGKNKLKLTEYTYTNKGLDWIITDSQVTISGTATDTYSSAAVLNCNFPVGSYKATFENNNSNLSYGIWLYNSQYKLISTIKNTPVTINEEASKFNLFVEGLTVGQTYNITLKPMVLLSTETDTTYEQYGATPSPEYPSEIKNLTGNTVCTVTNANNQEKTVTFPLGEQKLAKDDYLASDGIHHVREQKVLDGTEEWILGGGTNTNYQRFYLRLEDCIENETGIMCNILKEVYPGSTDIFYNDVEGINISNGKWLQFKVRKTIASTVQELKSYLAEQYSNGTPVILEYELAEEEIIPYTQAQQEAYNKLQNLILFEGYNHIEMTSSNGVKANLTVDYTKSTKMVINDIEERLSVLEYAGLEG